MTAAVRILFVILAVLLLVPGWTGKVRLDLLPAHPGVTAYRVDLDPRDPARRHVGRLTYLGGVELVGSDPAFGGYSALRVVGHRFTLLSDGGTILRFTMGADWHPRDVTGANVPTGPGTGWEKRDRDTESMASDGRHVWIGFERVNQIWRYESDMKRGAGFVAPSAMAKWSENGGPESLVRLADGRFVVISERSHTPPHWWPGSNESRLATRDSLIFAGDPVDAPPPQRFSIGEQGRYDISDAAVLPDGDLLLLNRVFELPFHFVTRVTRVRARDVEPGVIATPTTVATIGTPLIGENFEGLAITREGLSTILWMVSDDNQSVLQRTLLLKFRLNRN
jgi:hypothetical protein